MRDAKHLEAELGKEPPVLACLEPLLEAGLRGLAGGDLLVPGGERVGPARGDVLEVDVERVAGGHDVGEVYELDEALDAGLLGGLLGGVLADHLLGVLGQAGASRPTSSTTPSKRHSKAIQAGILPIPKNVVDVDLRHNATAMGP